MEEKTHKENNADNRENIITELLSLLEKMGCSWIENENGLYSVGIQGELFHFTVSNFWIRFWDLRWFSISRDDPSFIDLIESINIVNRSLGISLIFEHSKQDGSVEISTFRDVLFHPVLPYKEEYLFSVFRSLFTAREDLIRTFETMKRHRPDPMSLQ